jgi:kinesin family protein C2/C3
VDGLSSYKISNMDDATNVIQIGKANRAVASTDSNEHSSRSHCLVLINIIGKDVHTNDVIKAKLYLIDLAGYVLYCE